MIGYDAVGQGLKCQLSQPATEKNLCRHNNEWAPFSNQRENREIGFAFHILCPR